MSAASASRVVLVTGANKGIGFHIVETLLGDKNNVVLLGSRNEKRGGDAVNKLKKKFGSDARVQLLTIDLNKQKSIDRAAAAVKKEFGQIDVLINNAAIATKGDGFDGDIARRTIGTNYFGTRRVLDAFLPLVKKSGRVVNVSSRAGSRAMDACSKQLRKEFLADDLTIEQLDALMNKFIEDVDDGTWSKAGWARNTYGTSKIGVSMLTRIQGRDSNDILHLAICPGWVRTDMGGAHASKSGSEGADTPAWAAVTNALNAKEHNGTFWAERQQIKWCSSF